MPKRVEVAGFSPGVRELNIAKKAMAVIDTFLDTECCSEVTSSPEEASVIRESILHNVDNIVTLYCGKFDIVPTVYLASQLYDLADELSGYKDSAKDIHGVSFTDTAQRLNALADCLNAIVKRP